MNERKKKILQAIIHDYTQTAEPVGSRTIARKYDLGVSPATIRNEMADLEEMGLIEQPYTSAGRIPSDLGYRYYVDCIMEKSELSKVEEEHINKQYKTKVKEIEEVIFQTGKLLSNVTHYTSMIMTPQVGKKSIKHVQLIYMAPTQALVVIVMANGLVENKVMEIPESVKEEELNIISQVLNKKLQGLTIESVKKTVLQEIYSDLMRQKKTLDIILNVLDDSLDSEAGKDKVYLDGTLNILNQPEFKDVEKIRTLLGILNEEDIVRHILKVDKKGSGITIKIGEENKMDGFSDCSIITATYHIDGQVLGSVGVLGPTRMDYSKVVAVIEATTINLSEVLKKYYG